MRPKRWPGSVKLENRGRRGGGIGRGGRGGGGMAPGLNIFFGAEIPTKSNL